MDMRLASRLFARSVVGSGVVGLALLVATGCSAGATSRSGDHGAVDRPGTAVAEDWVREGLSAQPAGGSGSESTPTSTEATRGALGVPGTAFGGRQDAGEDDLGDLDDELEDLLRDEGDEPDDVPEPLDMGDDDDDALPLGDDDDDDDALPLGDDDDDDDALPLGDDDDDDDALPLGDDDDDDDTLLPDDDLDSILGDDDDDEPEETAPARRETPTPRETPSRPGGGGRVGAAAVFDAMKLQSEAATAEAAELVKQAQQLRLAGDLRRAEEYAERALKLEPESEDARDLLDEVRDLLGDAPSSTGNVSRDYLTRVAIERQMTLTEIRQAIHQATLYEELEEFDRAIESYRRATEMVRALPFDLKLDDELEQSQVGIERARKAKIAKEEEDRQELLKIIEQQKRNELTTSFDIVENQIRDLHRRAEEAMSSRHYERAATLFGQILELNLHDKIALRGKADAERLAHVQRMDKLLRQSVENYELAVVGVEESSIVYQEIFRYPRREEWLRISPKVISIEDQVSLSESARDKEIRRILERPISFGVPEEVELKDVLAELQELSGVNFFIAAGDGENPGEIMVQIDQLDNLSLRNMLNLILEKAGEGLTFVVKEGAVVIGATDSLEEPKYFRSYEISDLIRPRPDFEAPDLALDELAGKEAGADFDVDLGGLDDEGGRTVTDEEQLLELIGKELGGDDVEPEGIQIFGGKLSATVSLRDHLKLAKILDRFRLSTGMMVTVESRFLDIQDNFLEEIGVDWGGQQSFLPNTIPDADGAGTSLSPGYEFIDARGEFNMRAASVGALSNPIGSQVNPFQLSASGGGAYQINALDAERYQLEAILTAVAKEQEIRRLNSPRITAFNTQTAHTLVVQQAAYIQDLEVNQTGVIPVINPVIGVLNTGSILEVRPTISYDRKYIVLEIQPTLAEEIGRDIAVLNLSGNFTVVPVQLPILSVTKIKTTVNVPDGGTVLLGGLKREITTKASIGLPFVRHIPILNLIFGRKGESTLRANLFVLINAKTTIVHEEEAERFGTGVAADS